MARLQGIRRLAQRARAGVVPVAVLALATMPVARSDESRPAAPQPTRAVQPAQTTHAAPGIPRIPAGAIAILTRPVAVFAQPDAVPTPRAGFHPFTLTVARGDQAFTYRTSLVAAGDVASALAILRRTIGWRGGYLFVRQECGGGNAWRCDVDQVFALRRGVLARIGEQIGGRRNQAPGAAYRNAHFVDVYDRLENNPLTSHAAAPWFRIYMVDRDGVLAADLPFTWKKDVRRFESNRRELARIERDPRIDPRARDEAVASLLLHNAALARYCRQQDALDATGRDAKRLLTAERYRTFERLVAAVVPGELPRS